MSNSKESGFTIVAYACALEDGVGAVTDNEGDGNYSAVELPTKGDVVELQKLNEKLNNSNLAFNDGFYNGFKVQGEKIKSVEYKTVTGSFFETSMTDDSKKSITVKGNEGVYYFPHEIISQEGVAPGEFVYPYKTNYDGDYLNFKDTVTITVTYENGKKDSKAIEIKEDANGNLNARVIK